MIAITLYKWGDIYAFKRYVPRIAALRGMKKQDPQLADETAWVYGFKSAMKKADEIELYVRAAAARFACDHICAVPPSSVDDQPNSLQKLFGANIMRTHSVETRKYNHKKELPAGYADSYHIQGLEGPSSILLVDDVATTGKTILYFRDVLVAHGHRATPLVLGVNYRADYQPVDPLICVTVADGVEGRAGSADAAEDRLGSVADVYDYLQEAGWRISKPTLYRHHQERKFIPGVDGTCSRKDVDKYAKTWLKRQETGKKVRDRQDELQQKVLESELSIKEEELKKKKRQNEIDEGKYVPREQMEMELAAKAGIFETGIRYLIQSRIAEWIRTAGGDIKTASDLINLMIRDFEELIDGYARAKEFDVIIDGEEDEADDVSLRMEEQREEA